MNIQSEIKDCIKSIINMIDMVNHTEDDITLCIPFQMNCIIKPDASTLYQHPIRYMIDIITSYVKNKKINKKLYPILHSIPLCNENLSNLEKYEQNFDEFVFSPINKLAFQISIILTSHPPKEIFLIEGGFKYGKSVSQKNKVEIEYTSKELSMYDVYKYFV